MQDYARLHSYEYVVSAEWVDPGLMSAPGTWNKIGLLRQVLFLGSPPPLMKKWLNPNL